MGMYFLNRPKMVSVNYFALTSIFATQISFVRYKNLVCMTFRYLGFKCEKPYTTPEIFKILPVNQNARL
jgi:hypothetical protein